MALTKLVIDVATGSEEIIELTKEEVAEVKAAEAAAAKANADREAAEADKLANKGSLLQRLGITEEEAKLLLG